MSQTIDRGTLDRLIALGHAQGELSVDDLRAALPVEHMDVDALVLVMLELEAAGVSVEPDAFGPPVERPVTVPPALPAREAGAAHPARHADSAGAAARPAADQRTAAPDPLLGTNPEDRAGVNRAVALAGAATLLLLGVLLLML